LCAACQSGAQHAYANCDAIQEVAPGDRPVHAEFTIRSERAVVIFHKIQVSASGFKDVAWAKYGHVTKRGHRRTLIEEQEAPPGL
jgi:hypothetical protein